MAKDIKAEFGRLMRLSRDAKGMSRATLAMRLGISPKTIQSWEMGRTFIERLDLIPQLEAELECSLSSLIARATGAANSPPPASAASGMPGTLSAMAASPSFPADTVSTAMAVEGHHLMGSASQQRLLTRPGPLSPKFTLAPAHAQGVSAFDSERLELEWVSLPMVKPGAALNPVFEIQPKDILRHVIIPREWVPRAGVLVAVRMGDSAMMPMIPLGAIVVIDLRPLALDKTLGKVAALDFSGKGLRIRKVVRGETTGERYFGASVTDHGRARMPIRPDKGDRVLGEVVGILAPVG